MKAKRPILPAAGLKLAVAFAAAAAMILGPRAEAQLQDFGDAPSPYPTLLNNNGARHTVIPEFLLGNFVDTENDGQPNATATGDDLNPVGGADDEDGVSFAGALVPGQNAVANVFLNSVVGDGFLDAWMDFNGDGDWDDANEQIAAKFPLVPGNNTLSFLVPAGASGGATFARFRLSFNGGLRYDDDGFEGEVEDYQVNIEAQFLDFGDAPTNNYPTTLAANGARHDVNPQYCLGTLIDAEADGQPNSDATGDDINPSASDDEDGVTIGTLVAGQNATATVFLTASAGIGARLDAWIDFNRNGNWGDTGERIANSFPLVPGNNTLSFAVPSGAVGGSTFARFRLSRQGGLDFTGLGGEGEIEDYQVNITQQLDFGDAPDPYPTLLADNGARHSYNQSFFLGSLIDLEPDGQPTFAATGDDLNGPGGDDEDGVIQVGQLIAGRDGNVNVTASADGFLSAWMDFNGNGSWADTGEQIFTDRPLVAGLNALTFPIPANAKLGLTYARYRFTSEALKLSYDGPAPDGEVEDYQGRIASDAERCDLSCEGRDFWLTFPGNYAPDPTNRVRAELCIVGPVNVSATVAIPGLGFSTNVLIPATMSMRVALPVEADLGDLNDGITNRGIHVTATGDVAVYAFNQVYYTTDSYLGLPSSVLGRQYVVLGYGNVHTGVPPLNGTQFAITACESNTVVTITPSVDTGARLAGVPYNILLQPGDCYQLRNMDDAPADLTGTSITSDKPVAVFGSHQCANVPSSSEWYCDYIVEQLLPVKSWGTVFYTAPLATRTGGDTVRCLAALDNTSVFLNGAAAGIINQGQFLQFSLGAGAQITADKPVLVAQYANSADFDPPPGSFSQGDPFMCLVPATRHYASSYNFCTPATNFAGNHVNIVAPSAGIAGILLDGAAIPGPFTAIGATGLSYARVPVTPGRHALTGGVLFSAVVYGWAEYESYGHPACFYFGDLRAPTVNPGTTSSTVPVDTGTGTAAVPDYGSTAAPEDNCSPDLPPPTQTPRPATLLPPGVYSVELSVVDANGNVGTTNITLTVVDPTPVIINCPSNIFVDCTSSNGAVVDFLVTANTTYVTNIPVVSTPPSGSVFPPGTTVVNNTATSDAGMSNSCSFTITVRCSGELSIAKPVGGNVNLSWTGLPGFLEQAPAVQGPWQVVTGNVNSATIPVNLQSNAFFRVRY